MEINSFPLLFGMSAWIAIAFLFLGFFLQQLRSFPKEKVAQGGQALLIYLVLPALALLYIPPLKLGTALLLPISAAWFTFVLSWLVFGSLGKIFAWQKEVTGCLILVAGLANTSFLGFPVVEALYGNQGLTTALLIDQGGSFLLVATLSLWVGARYGKTNSENRKIIPTIFRFPPFLFLLGSIGLSLANLQVPDFMSSVLQGISMTMAPLALLVIGLRVSLDKEWIQSRFFWYGLGFRLVLAPLCVWIIYAQLLPTTSMEFKVTVMESAMAPMITGSLLAMEFGLQPRLAALLSGLGIPLSAITLGLWYWILG